MTTGTAALDRLKHALETHGSRSTDGGKNWTCPAHEDRTPSLSVGQGKKGAVLRCQANCQTEEIIRTIGLKMQDLFDPNDLHRNSSRSSGIDWEYGPVASYIYDHQNGTPLFEVGRFRMLEGGKTFLQRRPGRTDWRGGIKGVRRVPYRLPELLDAVAAGDPVYVCEGEKDVDRVRTAGWPATCNPGGAEKWLDEYAEHLRDASDVRVVADRDDPGYRHAAQVAASLQKVGATVRVLEAARGKDISDHLNAGLTLDDLVEIDLKERLSDPGHEPRHVPPEGEPHDGHDVGDIATFNITDLANAQRLVEHFGDELRWCPGVGFIVWIGTHWQASDSSAQRLASQLGRLIHAEAAQLQSQAAQSGDTAKREELASQAKGLIVWARTSESETKIRAALNLMKPFVEISVESLDTDPWALNVQNGTLDLKTGKLRSHRRDDLLTKLAPVEFDPDAKSELWETFLKRAIPDPDGRWFFQKAAGYSLAGVTGEDVLLVVHGPPRTGKGTSQDAVAATLGPYAITLGLEDLAHRDRPDGGRPRPELTRLRGARMASVYETSSSLRLSASLVKTLCGSDPITARAMYKEPVTFLPQFTLWIASNHRPEAPNDDEALWERIRELPFPTVIPPEERDPRVRAVLRDPDVSGAAILAWAIRGCLGWQREGLKPPEVVQTATKDYRKEMDPLGEFLEKCCVLGKGKWATASELRHAYENFSHENGDRPIGGRRWGAALRAHGCEDDREGGRRFWRGVGLRG